VLVREIRENNFNLLAEINIRDSKGFEPEENKLERAKTHDLLSLLRF